jgi:hypothetical protein
MSENDIPCSMATNPLSFHVSSTWMRNTCASKCLDAGNDAHDRLNSLRVTIDLKARKENDEKLKTVRDVNRLWKDIDTYRSQLRHMHGSIAIKTDPTPVEQCSCASNRSSTICKQILDFEIELCQQDCVEYVYRIESITNKDSILV